MPNQDIKAEIGDIIKVVHMGREDQSAQEILAKIEGVIPKMTEAPSGRAATNTLSDFQIGQNQMIAELRQALGLK